MGEKLVTGNDLQLSSRKNRKLLTPLRFGCFGRNVKTNLGDLGSKTAKQLYNSYQICSDHFEDSQYMDPAHTSLMPHAISIDFI